MKSVTAVFQTFCGCEKRMAIERVMPTFVFPIYRPLNFKNLEPDPTNLQHACRKFELIRTEELGDQVVGYYRESWPPTPESWQVPVPANGRG